MRYIDYVTLTNRMQLVDSHLFDGQEPFYADIRSSAPPYFVPYWMGDRPVYLTWQRPEPWTLGDYYYKRYGIMYKVQDIEYQLVDYLELKRSIPLSDAYKQFNNWLRRDVGIQYALDKIAKLEREGWIRRSGDSVVFVKMYPSPHEGDYFDNFLLRWHEAPNAKYWDFLTREIIVNYDYQMAEIHREEIGRLKEIRLHENRPEILAEIDRQIQTNWQMSKNNYEDAIVYGGDSISILHNVAVVYLNNDMEDMSDRAHELLTTAITLYPSSWGTYSVMFTYLIRRVLENPSIQEEVLAESDKWFEQLKRTMELYAEAKGDYQNFPQWPNFSGIEGYIQQLRMLPGVQLTAMQNQVEAALQNNPQGVDINAAEQVIIALYSRGIPFAYTPYIEKADKYFNKLLELKRSDVAFNTWAYSIAMQLNRTEQVYTIGKNLERLGGAPNDYNFYYSMGMTSVALGKKADAVNYLNKFLNAVSLDRMASMQLSQRGEIARVKKIIAELSGS
jgi:tetratricopeptide (TPR) repeat protein